MSSTACEPADLPAEVRIVRLRRVAGLAGLGTAALGMLVLIGWVFDQPLMTTVAPGLVTMKFNTASALVALGLSTWLLSMSSIDRRALRVGGFLLGAVALLGTATLIEYTAAIDLGIDNPFGFDRAGAAGTSQPGRMSPVSAACLAGLSLALLALSTERVRHAQFIAAATLTMSAIALVGYLFNFELLYRVSGYTSMAVHTAAAVGVLSLSVLFLRAEHGFMLLVAGDSIGGTVLRRLLPWVLVTPVATGALLVAGLERDWYDERFAVAVLVTFGSLAGAVVVWVQARRLRAVDLRREDAEEVRTRLQASLADRDRLTAELTGSESHARHVVENSADAYIALSSVGHVEDWNESATRLFGWTREEAFGRTLDRLIIPAELAGAHHAGLNRAAATGSGPLLGRPVELGALHRDGHRLQVELTIWSVRADDTWGFHAFLRDVTARKAAEAELNRMNEDLQQFAGVVAHDLRTPLTTITGYAELLRESAELSGLDPQTLDWIMRVEGAARRGTDLISDLLSLTQIGLGELNTEAVPLGALVDSVVRDQGSLGHDGATIQVAALPTVLGDPSLLRQLFANLIGNALKYADDGSPPTVHVGVVPGQSAGCVIVQVSDDGPGIPVSERAQVFDMFQRGTGVGAIGGTGIGLAISRQVVERHRGRIWVEDSALGGAAFNVELPGVPVPR